MCVRGRARDPSNLPLLMMDCPDDHKRYTDQMPVWEDEERAGGGSLHLSTRFRCRLLQVLTRTLREILRCDDRGATWRPPPLYVVV